MSNFTLTISASAATLAQILQSIPPDLATRNDPVFDMAPAPEPVAPGAAVPPPPQPVPNDPSRMTGNIMGAPAIPIGTGGPMPSAPTMPVATMPAFSPPAQSEEEADGPAPTGDVDSNGIRWDERIHSGAKTTTAAGAWKKRKGVEAALITAVEAEQRGVPAGAAAAAAVMPVAPPIMPLAPSMPVPNAPVAMPSALVVPAAPMPSIPAAPSDAPIDFMGLLGHVAKLTEAQRVDATYLADLVQRITAATGTPLKSLVDLNGKPELIAYTVQVMTHDGRW